MERLKHFFILKDGVRMLLVVMCRWACEILEFLFVCLNIVLDDAIFVFSLGESVL